MAMNLSSNPTPTPEIISTYSEMEENAQQPGDDVLAKLADVERGWANQFYACFSRGLCVEWTPFLEQFNNMTWERKYLDEGRGTWVS